MIVDSHQHFWQTGRFDYPWMSPELGVLYRDFLPPDLEPIIKQHGVAKTVLVQASNSLAETQWLLSLADSYPFIAGVVGWADLTDPGLGDDLDVLKANPKFKGVRHLVESEPAEDWLVQPEVLRGLQTLAVHGVSYDLLVHTRHLKHARTVAENIPELRLVIDHMAKPPIARGVIKEWARKLAAAKGDQRRQFKAQVRPPVGDGKRSRICMVTGASGIGENRIAVERVGSRRPSTGLRFSGDESGVRRARLEIARHAIQSLYAGFPARSVLSDLNDIATR